jgi:hypothetical protein
MVVAKSFPINAKGTTIPTITNCGIKAKEVIETTCFGNAELKYNVK